MTAAGSFDLSLHTQTESINPHTLFLWPFMLGDGHKHIDTQNQSWRHTRAVVRNHAVTALERRLLGDEEPTQEVCGICVGLSHSTQVNLQVNILISVLVSIVLLKLLLINWH